MIGGRVHRPKYSAMNHCLCWEELHERRESLDGVSGLVSGFVTELRRKAGEAIMARNSGMHGLVVGVGVAPVCLLHLAWRMYIRLQAVGKLWASYGRSYGTSSVLRRFSFGLEYIFWVLCVLPDCVRQSQCSVQVPNCAHTYTHSRASFCKTYPACRYPDLDPTNAGWNPKHLP